jgi:hypothetical protein
LGLNAGSVENQIAFTQRYKHNELVCQSCEIRVDSRDKMRHGFASAQLASL